MLEKIKISNKIQVIILFLVIQILTFVVGLVSGRSFASSETKLPSLHPNYTINQPEIKAISNPDLSPNSKLAANNTPSTATNDDCTKIKGNISSKSKIYHLPGGSFYKRTKAEMCFDTEQEAIKAGFTKSSR